MVGILLNIVLLNITIHETSICNRKNGWISQSMSWILVRCLSLTNCLTSDSISNGYVYRKRAHFDWLCEDLSPFLGGSKWASESGFDKLPSNSSSLSTEARHMSSARSRVLRRNPCGQLQHSVGLKMGEMMITVTDFLDRMGSSNYFLETNLSFKRVFNTTYPVASSVVRGIGISLYYATRFRIYQ